jgi:hypothetical protein
LAWVQCCSCLGNESKECELTENNVISNPLGTKKLVTKENKNNTVYTKITWPISQTIKTQVLMLEVH